MVVLLARLTTQTETAHPVCLSYSICRDDIDVLYIYIYNAIQKYDTFNMCIILYIYIYQRIQRKINILCICICMYIYIYCPWLI